MLKHVVATVAAVTLFAGALQAREIPTSPEECASLVSVTKTVVEAQPPKAEAAQSVNALVVQLDQQCADSKYEDAQKTAETVIAKVTEGD